MKKAKFIGSILFIPIFFMSACVQGASNEGSNTSVIDMTKDPSSVTASQSNKSSEEVIIDSPFTLAYTSDEKYITHEEYKYQYPYNDEIAIFDGNLIELIGGDKFDEWIYEFKSVDGFPEKTEYRNWNELNIITFVREFQISRADFEKYMESSDFYTKEVIDAVYSDDVKAINKAFCNPYAMYYEGEIYTMQWFEEHSAADFESEGIPLQEIESYLERVKPSFTDSKYEDTEENKEFKALEKKVSEYAKSAN